MNVLKARTSLAFRNAVAPPFTLGLAVAGALASCGWRCSLGGTRRVGACHAATRGRRKAATSLGVSHKRPSVCVHMESAHHCSRCALANGTCMLQRQRGGSAAASCCGALYGKAVTV